ncbi:MAG: murein biosynthesis integral membrane protein MurJ [Candidatus Levybacteria bacterium RIFCSPLOWO2_01_FULL_36_13]|nr:MAG: murein biosynthesis integral membrane protein MurJ [Candidatus Levybacteria bacterium RIFCSPHIGHO2_01_FULL_36_15b]OGH34295.1 MAG: murein biosynthesis integral membrane protein MurJ [Candidatus Levybacteria bacterium RIFCSPLOWO2_01_FULL_36_13]
MPTEFFKKGLGLLLKRQSNIISAAVVIMGTIIFSQALGLVRQRLLVSIFGASDTLGIYLASTRIPEFFFQLIIAGALTSAFIPVFSDYLAKDKEAEAKKIASTLLFLSLIVFSIVSCFLIIFAREISSIVAPGFSPSQIDLMTNLTRIIIFGEIIFIIGSFFSSILQSYNHFFIPGIASALYNLGIIIGIFFLYQLFGIYSAAYGVILGAIIFVLAQLPTVRSLGFSLKPNLSLESIRNSAVLDVFKLIWPRTLSIAIFQLGSLVTVTLVSFLQNPGRNYVIYDYAQTLAFAPVALFGQAIAQASFPVLSKEKDNPEHFKLTFMTSFNQLFYLILPISVLLLVLRIPIVRLIYGASQFDWQATVLTGRTLSFFAISLFAQALVYLVARGFYALHDTKTPLIIGTISTFLMIIFASVFIFYYNLGVESIALAYSIGSIFNFVIMFIFLDIKIGGFPKRQFIVSTTKILLATFFTAFALYIPIKLLDQLVFDTTKTVNLILLTGISSFAGLSLYLFLTWLFNVKEATMFILLFKKIGDWRQILSGSSESIDGTRLNP